MIKNYKVAWCNLLALRWILHSHDVNVITRPQKIPNIKTIEYKIHKNDWYVTLMGVIKMNWTRLLLA